MYYKILRRNEEGILVSCSAIPNKYKVQYVHGKKTFPVIGKLFVRDNRDFSDIVPRNATSLEVWECEVGNPIEWDFVLDLYARNQSEKVKNYWDSVNPKGGVFDFKVIIVTTIKGTYACDWIEITERVE